MILLGVVLLVLGLIFGIHLLVVAGIIVALVGLVLMIAQTPGPVRGRWY